MLQSLTIRNIALIEELTIPFGRGLHTLTGETGAGKSIVVDAVNLVLGGRGDRGLIRTGAERASVEAVFDVSGNPAAQSWLAEQGLGEAGEPLILWRELTAAGKTLCRICGVVTPLTSLRELAALLMDVHGQHETRFLMDDRYHLSLLDSAGDAAHQQLLRETAGACADFLDCHRRYAKLVRENEQRQARMAELTEDLAELDGAKLQPGEEEKLTRERDELRHAEKIAAALRLAYSSIAEGDLEPALAKLKPAADAMGQIAPLGEKYQSLSARLQSAYYELEEVSYELAGLLESDLFDPNRAEAVENRLQLIARLTRRHGTDIPGLLRRAEEMRGELDRFASMDGELRRLGAEDKKRLARYRQAAKALTESRTELAGRFEQGMEEQLRDLGMERTVLRAVFAPKPEKARMPRPTGDDEVSFMISPNPGEPLRPLAKIASGGELSRLMLALKNMEASHAGVDCMVFDEIDTGISGRVAQAVAEKMANIAASRQVLCVTHLPQLAAMADVPLLVRKEVVDGRTYTRVQRLDAAAHAEEVARMLGGADGSLESALSHARSMIASAAERKEKSGRL